jgi:hypothetical protein
VSQFFVFSPDLTISPHTYTWWFSIYTSLDSLWVQL